MDEAQKQLTDKLKSSNNVLLTVGRNPSVDQLAALLGLTVFLNKQGKHAAAVFSGEVPSTIEFLRPEETIEKNTDSLRDFIIALDKSKADKLRYKVEDDIVRIFITPFKTSISQNDFEFSQGDFNVDLVLAIGVKQQDDLDEAVIAHGRILHDATVATINNSADGGIGTINWHDDKASSLSELATELVQSLGKEQVDEQIATALLTGIVAETDRFSNDKTTAETMSASAALMQAGANQQLVASKLQEGGDNTIPNEGEAPAEGSDSSNENHDGTLEISHGDNDESPALELPTPDEDSASSDMGAQDIPEGDNHQDEQVSNLSPGSSMIIEPPTLGGVLTANTEQEGLDPAIDPLSLSGNDHPQILSRKGTLVPSPPEGSEEPQTTQPQEDVPSGAPRQPLAPEPKIEEPLPAPPEPEPLITAAPPTPSFTPPPVSWSPPADDNPAEEPAKTDDSGPYSTLAQLEESVGSSHADASANPNPPALNAARDEVNRALGEASAAGNVPPEPVQALGAQPLGDELHPSNNPLVPQPDLPAADVPHVTDPNAPPPVPPPIPFQFGNQPPQK